MILSQAHEIHFPDIPGIQSQQMYKYKNTWKQSSSLGSWLVMDEANTFPQK